MRESENNKYHHLQSKSIHDEFLFSGRSPAMCCQPKHPDIGIDLKTLIGKSAVEGQVMSPSNEMKMKPGEGASIFFQLLYFFYCNCFQQIKCFKRSIYVNQYSLCTSI
jgi:hypothetical protein